MPDTSKSTAVSAPADKSVAVYANNSTRILDDDALSAVVSYEDVNRLFADYGIVPEAVEQYGTGFEILSSKTVLVGIPFGILEWRFNASSLNDAGFVSALVVTQRGDKYVMNDGGAGIFQQLKTITLKRLAKGHAAPQAGLLVNKGLAESNYDTVQNINGKDVTIAGTTFYLAGM